jgi:hypothetical protein
MLFGPPKNSNGEEHRYYLLPGMGRANRRKRVRIFWASVITGLILSLIFAGILYMLNRRGPSIFSPGE